MEYKLRSFSRYINVERLKTTYSFDFFVDSEKNDDSIDAQQAN